VTVDTRQAAAIFDPQRLRIARQLQGWQRTELAEKVGVSAAAISQFELGRSKPRPATLAQIALSLKLPVSFFASTGRPLPALDAEETFFRSLRRTTKRDRERALAHASLLAEIARLVDERVHLPRLDVPDELTLSPDAPVEAAEECAMEVRRRWDLGDGPIVNVVRLLERKGIIVARFPLMSDDVDAFSWPLSERPLVVLGSDKRNYERSRLDAAHEFGHLIMHHADPEPGLQPMERQANRFASALLTPAEGIRDELPTGRVDWSQLLAVKERWGISLGALLYRARDLGTMSPTAYETALKYMASRGWRMREPGRMRRPEEPKLLQKAIAVLEDNGTTLEALAARQNLLPSVQLSELLQLLPARRPTVAV
jgi:Zn-dependent peptidase ImmA (M78 family)/DNA-binding XRE family transcriptional regulator